jgi:hypothetical protein
MQYLMPKRSRASTSGVSAWIISDVFICDIDIDGSFADKKRDQQFHSL